MIYLALVALLVALLAGWLMTLLSLPGNWVIVASLALVVGLFVDAPAWHLTWRLVAIEAGLALAAELLELTAGALGAARLGGSKRAALLAIVGSFAGALVGASLGLPVPILGSLVGVLFGASCGALLGAMLGEAWKGRDAQQRWQVGKAAFWGRLFGSLAKLTISTTMVVLALASMVMSFF